MQRSKRGADVVIGVVGPSDLVERIVLFGGQKRKPSGIEARSWRLVGASYRTETEAAGKLAKLQDDVDVVLFTGPLPYDIVRDADVLQVPATYVPMSGAALFSTMLRAQLSSDVDLTRISVDSLSRTDVHEAFAEVELPVRRVRVKAYESPANAAAFASWHENLYRQRRSSAAFTTVRSVFRRLERAGVPAFRILPTASSFRSALRTAALLGSDSRLQEAQVAVGLVVLPESASRSSSVDWQHDMRLRVHQILVREARPVGATVLPRDERSYFVATTLGSLRQATEEFRVAPFVAAVNEAIGVQIDVGFGLGRTTLEAEQGALRAVEHAAREPGAHRCVLERDGTMLALPSHGHDTAAMTTPNRARGLELVHRISAALETEGGGTGPPVVDAEQAADLLDVSPRTARRVLTELVDEGLAWPLPRPRGSGRGRPRHLYRLIVPDDSS